MKATGLYPAALLLLLLAGAVSYAATLNVPGGYSAIQMALSAAHNGDVVIVAPGTYRESINFNGKAVVLRSSNPSDWSVVAATVIDGGGKGSVVTFNHGEGAGSQLLGFKITNGLAAKGGGILCVGASPIITGNLITGNATTPGADGANAAASSGEGGEWGGDGGVGGGIYCSGGSATITGNRITANTTGAGGSGGNADPTVPQDGGYGGTGGHGGGVALESSTALLSGNVITGNSTGSGGHGGDAGEAPYFVMGRYGGNGGYGGDGGGVCTTGGSPVVRNNVVAGNRAGDGGIGGDSPDPMRYSFGGAGGSGGGIATDAAVIQNNTVVGNEYGQDGYGQYTAPDDDPTNATGAGVYSDGGTVNSCIIADNGEAGFGVGYSVDGSAAVSYCDVFGNPNDPGGWLPAGPGNIAVDPLFADSAGGDYHLKPKVGRWNGSTWVVDAIHSPCIDAGDPTLPFFNEPEPNGDRVNMGAYGNTPQASKSLGPPPARQPDMLIGQGGTWLGGDIYNTTGVGQTLSVTTPPGVMTPFSLRVRNNGKVVDNIKITGPAGNATWQVHYFNAPSGGTDITSQVTGTGWIAKIVVSAAVDFRVEVTPAASCPANASYALSVRGTSQGNPSKSDVVIAATTCVPTPKPDLMLRAVQSSSTPFTGENVYNTTGAGQTLSKATNPGVTTPFFLRVRNNGDGLDSIKITGPGGNATWYVHYFNAASGGTDITFQVTGGGWTVVVAAGAAVDFRAEVTPDPSSPGNAAYTLGILAASQGDPSKSDLVKAVTTCTQWW